MSLSTISLILVVVGVIVSIVVSNKLNINGGIIAMVFAWFIACVINKTTVSTLVGYWPTTVMFIIISTGLFFGVARSNGTLTNLAQKIIWKFRGAPALLPFGVFITGFIVGAAGAGSIAGQLFLATLIYGMASDLGINVLVFMVAAWGGSTAGGGMFWSAEGANRIAYYGQVGGPVTADVVSKSVAIYSIYLFAALLILTIIYYVILGGWKAKGSITNLKEPEPFNPEQKKTMTLIVIAVILILVPAILKMVAPSDFTKSLARMFDIQAVCIVGFLVAVLMGLCEDKKIISTIPLNLILTIAGYCMLIKVAIGFDLPKIFGNVLQNAGLPNWIIPSMFLFFSCIISLFSNFAVIYPLMFPLIPVISAATGINSLALFIGTCLGSCCTGFSPFSTGGACELTGCRDDALQQKLVPRMLIMAFCNAIILMIFGALGLFGLFPDPLAL